MRLSLLTPKLAVLFVGLAIYAGLFGSAVEANEPVALLEDTAFAEGFGAAFIYGNKYSGGRRPPLGELLDYRDIHPFQVRLIPEGPVKKVGVVTHPWDFQEGYHQNFTTRSGRKVKELHTHRLVVNHVVEKNDPNRLQFAQFNNDGLPKSDPQRNTQLVKRITSDRNGTLRIYYNSKNEIRNAATGHSARWARDTWPHLLVNQRFPKPVAVKDYESISLDVGFQVDHMDRLSNWPNAIRGAARSGMNLKFMLFLRNQSDLDQKLFAGMMLYASNPKRFTPYLGVEQHGNIFYRASVTVDGRNAPGLGEHHAVTVDVIDLLKTAIEQGREKQPHLSASLEDYALYNFSIGFEGMGHWETEAVIDGLDLVGIPKEDDVPEGNSILRDAGKTEDDSKQP